MVICFNFNNGDLQRFKTVLADADTDTVITVFYIEEHIVVNSHPDDRI